MLYARARTAYRITHNIHPGQLCGRFVFAQLSQYVWKPSLTMKFSGD